MGPWRFAHWHLRPEGVPGASHLQSDWGLTFNFKRFCLALLMVLGSIGSAVVDLVSENPRNPQCRGIPWCCSSRRCYPLHFHSRLVDFTSSETRILLHSALAWKEPIIV